MKIPLIYDEKDPKWMLLCKILKIFDRRRTKQELSKNGLTPLKRSVSILKIVMIALFFNLEVSYVVSEFNRNKKLKKQLGIDRVFNAEQISEFLSRHSEEYWCEFTIKLLNNINFKNTRGIRTIIVDGTDIQIDLNWFGRKISKKSLDEKPYKWGYSSSKSFYIGLKLTLALDCRTMQPLTMLLHEGSPNDAKIFSEIMDELKRRRITRKGDKILFDKGYFSKENYEKAILNYESAVLIFPRGNNPLRKVFDNISYPLECFTGKNRKKELYMLGNINMSVEKFREIYSGKAIIINGTENNTILTRNEMEETVGGFKLQYYGRKAVIVKGHSVYGKGTIRGIAVVRFARSSKYIRYFVGFSYNLGYKHKNVKQIVHSTNYGFFLPYGTSANTLTYRMPYIQYLVNGKLWLGGFRAG